MPVINQKWRRDILRKSRHDHFLFPVELGTDKFIENNNNRNLEQGLVNNARTFLASLPWDGVFWVESYGK